jgi:hypothetical protein
VGGPHRQGGQRRPRARPGLRHRTRPTRRRARKPTVVSVLGGGPGWPAAASRRKTGASCRQQSRRCLSAEPSTSPLRQTSPRASCSHLARGHQIVALGTGHVDDLWELPHKCSEPIAVPVLRRRNRRSPLRRTAGRIPRCTAGSQRSRAHSKASQRSRWPRASATSFAQIAGANETPR